MRAGRKRKIGHRYASGDLKRTDEHERRGFAAVYVIEISDGLVKIGVTATIRIRALAHDRNYKNSALICCFWMEEARARELEKTIHAEFRGKPFHAGGEKYYLDAETAIAMIKPMIGTESEIVGLERFDLTKPPSATEYAFCTSSVQAWLRWDKK